LKAVKQLPRTNS